MERLVFCKDCRHVTNAGRQCQRSEPQPDYYVTGVPTYQYCTVMRMKGSPCGPEGKLFEVILHPVAA